MTDKQVAAMERAYETYKKHAQPATSCPLCHSTHSVDTTLQSEPGTHYCYRCSDWFTPAAEPTPEIAFQPPKIGATLHLKTPPKFVATAGAAPTNQMVASMEATFHKCIATSKRKSNDYASADNPYRNFEGCTRFGLTVQQGLMVRISDKYSRLENIMSGKTLQVTEETADDTIEDLINYLAILKAHRQLDADKK